MAHMCAGTRHHQQKIALEQLGLWCPNLYRGYLRRRRALEQLSKNGNFILAQIARNRAETTNILHKYGKLAER